jgi:Ran GTPase-activating protein (RanGAP) involved in mRNA processing and transport
MRQEILDKIITANKSNRISLCNMQILDEEILEIINNIKFYSPNVHTIDLDHNHIGDEGAKILGENLTSFENLAEISIQFNHIGKAGAIKLFSLKQKFPNLDILFHGNQITNVTEMNEIEHITTHSDGFQKR